MEFLFAKLSHVAEKVSCFSVCGLKEILPYIKNVKQSSAFDVIVAAYLLNPLKSDYTYEDVAEQYLGIAGGIQAELNVKCCYEAYTAFAYDRIFFCQFFQHICRCRVSGFCLFRMWHI